MKKDSYCVEVKNMKIYRNLNSPKQTGRRHQPCVCSCMETPANRQLVHRIETRFGQILVYQHTDGPLPNFATVSLLRGKDESKFSNWFLLNTFVSNRGAGR